MQLLTTHRTLGEVDYDPRYGHCAQPAMHSSVSSSGSASGQVNPAGEASRWETALERRKAPSTESCKLPWTGLAHSQVSAIKLELVARVELA